MTKQHWLAIGMILAAIGAQGSSAHSWTEVFAPGFIFGSFAAIGAVLVGIFSDKPGQLSREELDGIRQGIEDIRAGRVRSLDDVIDNKAAKLP